MTDHPPATVTVAHEHVESGDRRPSLSPQQVLIDGDPCDISEDVGALFGQQELQRPRSLKESKKRRGDAAPASQRRPSGVGAGGSVRAVPQIGHGIEVPSLKRVVKAVVGGQHRRDNIDALSLLGSVAAELCPGSYSFT